MAKRCKPDKKSVEFRIMAWQRLARMRGFHGSTPLPPTAFGIDRFLKEGHNGINDIIKSLIYV